MPEPQQQDPLWLRSPGKRAAMGLAYVASCTLIGALLGALLGFARWGALTGCLLGAVALASTAQLMPRALGRMSGLMREALWRDREGVHHSFAGVPLTVHDDGRQLWLHERGLRTLLGLQRDPADAFKARFTGHWREARELGLRGQDLWLDAAAVHRHLAEAPERMDPKRVRLRAYLDREILQPASRRRDRHQ